MVVVAVARKDDEFVGIHATSYPYTKNQAMFVYTTISKNVVVLVCRSGVRIRERLGGW